MAPVIIVYPIAQGMCVTVRYGTVRYGTVRYGTVRYAIVCPERVGRLVTRLLHIQHCAWVVVLLHVFIRCFYFIIRERSHEWIRLLLTQCI